MSRSVDLHRLHDALERVGASTSEEKIVIAIARKCGVAGCVVTLRDLLPLARLKSRRQSYEGILAALDHGLILRERRGATYWYAIAPAFAAAP